MPEAPPTKVKSPCAIRYPENKNRNRRKKVKISTPQQKAIDQRLELANMPGFKNRTIKGVPTQAGTKDLEKCVVLTLGTSI